MIAISKYSSRLDNQFHHQFISLKKANEDAIAHWETGWGEGIITLVMDTTGITNENAGFAVLITIYRPDYNMWTEWRIRKNSSI